MFLHVAFLFQTKIRWTIQLKNKLIISPFAKINIAKIDSQTANCDPLVRTLHVFPFLFFPLFFSSRLSRIFKTDVPVWNVQEEERERQENEALRVKKETEEKAFLEAQTKQVNNVCLREKKRFFEVYTIDTKVVHACLTNGCRIFILMNNVLSRFDRSRIH